MPLWCGVVGCSNNDGTGKQVRFYKLFAILEHLDSRMHMRDLSTERSARWLASITIVIAKTLPPMQLHKTKSTLLACGDHFIKG